MGMFDSLRTKRELPLPEELKPLNINWTEQEFQTKDLENCLLNYWISENGELFEHVVEREYVPYSEEEKKSKNHKPWDLWKDVIEKEERDEKIDYHGKLNFYTNGNFSENQDFWVEFNAYFIYGKLDKIELSKFEFSESNKVLNRKWEQEYLQRQKQPWNRFKHYASYLGWKWFWRKVSNVLYFISEKISIIRTFIIRNCL